jgi:hypothetical protein
MCLYVISRSGPLLFGVRSSVGPLGPLVGPRRSIEDVVHEVEEKWGLDGSAVPDRFGGS